MLTLPIPMFGALVLAFLFLRLVMAEKRVGPLAFLIGICAVQSLVISLAQHYQLAGWRLAQPICASFIPATAWLAFVASAVRRPVPRDALHMAGPLLAALALAVWPAALDIVIPLLFLGYAAAILARLRRGMDALPRLRLEAGDLPVRVWIVIAVTLGLSSFSDVIILAVQSAGAAGLQPVLISLFSAANLLLIGGLSLTGGLRSEPEGDSADRTAAPRSVATEEDGEIMDRLTALMETQRPFLDPDLTLVRLARKLGVPAKTLSAAINRTTGQNVSRFINDARIAEAQRRLEAGDAVTSAIYAAGFNTKSNFNREFLRVTGLNPTAWMKDHGLAG